MDASRERRRLPSSAKGRLRQLRRELVLQLYLRRGPLWEAVRDVRDRRNIVPKVQLPPSVRDRLLPQDAPDFDNRAEYVKYTVGWEEEISAVRERVIPTQDWSTRGSFDHELEASWSNFLSACTLYDPPEDRLIEFASYGGPEPTVFSGGRLPTERNLEGLPEMIDPPIKTLADLVDVRNWYWHRILNHIVERYLEPQGVDVDTLLETVMWEVPGLYEEHVEKYKEYSERFYIEVDEYTTWEDVESALQMIRSIERPKRRKPPRDSLIAVQCAILHDRYNQACSQDRRYRRWTYAKLAEHFDDLIGPRAAEDYVKLGRKILRGEDPDKI